MQIWRRIPYWGVVGFLMYMPFHVFLAQSLSLITGGLEAWKIGKDVLLVVLLVFTICLVWKQGRVPRWFTGLVLVTVAYGLLHVIIGLLHPQVYRESALIGTTYNVRVFCLVVMGAGAALLNPDMFTFRSLSRLVLGISSVVALLAVLQYFLPKDILSHVGYGLDRGVRPNFFIDDNPAFPRVMATLRDPNSLGAYLLLPLALLTGLLLKLKQFTANRRLVLVGLALLHLTALYLTFSRSAWAGAVLAIGLVIWWQFSSQFVRIIQKWWLVGAAVLVVLVSVVWWQRANPVFDGILTHSTTAQLGEYDSNEYHLLFLGRGLAGIWHEPLGHGPGTAGLAAVRDPQQSGILTENYYVQIGYEVGILGLALFIGLNVWLYIRLWRRHDQWTVVLLSSFWAYVFVNLLLHIWSNEAVAAQWWLLAGVAVAAPLTVKSAASAAGRSRATKRRAAA